MQSVFSHYEFCFRVEDDEVGIASFGNAAFDGGAAGESSWLLRHPAAKIAQGESTPTGFGPHYRKRQGKAGNSSPGGVEVSLFDALHGRRTGRVVGRYEVDDSAF
jgi:hypothetical protein